MLHTGTALVLWKGDPETDNHTEKLKKIYAIAVCFVFPIFGLYSLIGSFGWAHLYLCIVFIILYIDCLRKNCLEYDRRFLEIVIYTIFQTLFISMFLERVNGVDLWLKVLQWLLFILTIAMFNHTYFDYKIMQKILRITVVLSCAYLLVQQAIAWVFHIYLPPGIPFLPYVREELKSAYYSLYIYGGIYRPRSFFSEPALFCQFALSALTIELFNREEDKNWKYILLLILSIGISKSGTGYFVLAFILLAYGLIGISKKRKLQKKYLPLVILAIPIDLALVMIIPDVQRVWQRFFGGETFLSNLVGQERFKSIFISQVFKESNVLKMVFGRGFSLDDYTGFYLGGLLRHFYCFGLVGVFILIYTMVRIYIMGNTMQRMLILVFLFMSTGANPLHNSDLMIPLAFASFPMGGGTFVVEDT